MTEDDLTPREKGRLEGYAAALDDIIRKVTGDGLSAKRYDPMTIEGGTIHSYAFDLKDGGRHHPLGDYVNADEIRELMLAEAYEALCST